MRKKERNPSHRRLEPRGFNGRWITRKPETLLGKQGLLARRRNVNRRFIRLKYLLKFPRVIAPFFANGSEFHNFLSR